MKYLSLVLVANAFSAIPKGFRVITQEILVVPPRIKDGSRPMPIGPDAVM